MSTLKRIAHCRLLRFHFGVADQLVKRIQRFSSGRIFHFKMAGKYLDLLCTDWQRLWQLIVAKHAIRVLKIDQWSRLSIYYASESIYVRPAGGLSLQRVKIIHSMTDIVLGAIRCFNCGLRSVVPEDPTFYIRLFKVYVEPLTTYAAFACCPKNTVRANKLL